MLLKVQPPHAGAKSTRSPPAPSSSASCSRIASSTSCARLRDRRITSFAIELIPRISRAQSMDALSSQAAAAGYKAALLAASALDKFLPMLTTAAGTIRPAQVLVIGAGVAGLQAIATARRLGAIVEAYDVRAATKEQIQSLGAKFVDTGVAAEGTGGYARELTAEEKAKQQAILDRAHREGRRRDHDGRDPGAHGAAHHLEERRRGDGLPAPSSSISPRKAAATAS